MGAQAASLLRKEAVKLLVPPLGVIPGKGTAPTIIWASWGWGWHRTSVKERPDLQINSEKDTETQLQ